MSVIASVWEALAAPWSEPLMRRALVEVLLISLCGGALGCWVILYRLAYSAEALAHALLPGLVVAALLGLPLMLGAGAGIVAGAGAVAVAGRSPRIGADTAVAIVTTTLFGAGVLLALSADTPPGLHQLLFGDVLGVSQRELLLSLVLVLLVLGMLVLLHHRLLAVGFDRADAAAHGLRPLRIDAALLVLVALALLVAVQGLGNLLVVAVLVAPALSARRHARRMPSLLMLAILVACASGVAGLYLSYYAGIASGAAIALVLVATTTVALLLPPRAKARGHALAASG